MDSVASIELRTRLQDRISAWRVVVERLAETESALIALGRREGQPVVLKVMRKDGDERRSGEILAAFGGRGVVRVFEHEEGALLLERLTPGRSLSLLALGGRDDQATEILADVIGKMSPGASPSSAPTVEDWGDGFERQAARRDTRIPRALLEEARGIYTELCRSQARPRLLHGDLHHYNVLYDSRRGWVAIDPKGVIGELEYEVGASLRNPYERPDLFTRPAAIERRLERFALTLKLDARRMLAWSFAQAVLSAIWAVEDTRGGEPRGSWIALAEAIRPILRGARGPTWRWS